MAGLGLEAAVMNILIGPKLSDTFGSTLGDQLDKAVGPAADKAGKTLGEKLTAGFDKAGKSLSKNVTAPLLAIGGAAVAVGLDIDDALDAIRVGTGATGDTLAQLEDDFRNVAKSTTAGFGDIGDVIADLNTRLGLTGEPLRVLAEQLLDLQQITGEAASTEAVADLFKTFGVAAEQQSQVLDQIFRASQASGVSFNNLTQSVGQNAARFKELGIPLSEAVALIASVEKAGLSADSVLTGLQRGILKSVGGSDDIVKAQTELTKAQNDQQVASQKLAAATAKLNEVRADPKATQSQILAAEATVTQFENAVDESINKVAGLQAVIDKAAKLPAGTNAGQFLQSTVAEIERLIAAGDRVGATEIAKETFGRGFLEVLAAIESGAFNTDAFVAEIQQGTDSITGLADETADFPEKFAQLKNSIGLALEPLAQTIIPAITAAVTNFIPVVERVSVAFASLSPGVQQAIVVVAGLAAALGPTLLIFGKMIAVIGQIGTALKAVTALLVANPWVLLAAAAVAAVILIIQNWDKVAAFFSAIWEIIAGGAAALWDGLAGGATAAFEAIKEAVLAGVETIRAVFDGIKDLGKNIWEGLKAGTTAAFTFVQTKVTETINKIRDVFSKAANLGKSIWDGLKNGAQGAITAVGNVAKGIVNSIAGAWNNTIAKISFSLPSWIPKIGGSRWGVPKIPMLAEGGLAMANRPAIVGELGPELFVPKVSGTVVPNNQLGGAMGGPSYTITINNPTAEPSSTSIPNALRKANYLRS